jgi:hypothetical protein
MIDLTSIQTYPAPLEIEILHTNLSNLEDENRIFKMILLAIGIAGVFYIGYKIFKSYENNERKETTYP